MDRPADPGQPPSCANSDIERQQQYDQLAYYFVAS
jgi:hypothetical protein